MTFNQVYAAVLPRARRWVEERVEWMSFATTIDLTKVGPALKDAGVTNVTARHHGLLVTSPLINQSVKPSTKTNIRCNNHMVYELSPFFLTNDISTGAVDPSATEANKLDAVSYMNGKRGKRNTREIQEKCKRKDGRQEKYKRKDGRQEKCKRKDGRQEKCKRKENPP